MKHTFGFSYWDINEPNSNAGADEDCGELKFFNDEKSWNDKSCGIPNIWICEKNVALLSN